MYYTLHFSTQCSLTSAVFCQRETRAYIPFLYQLEFCIQLLILFHNNRVITTKPSCTDGNFEDFKEVEIWGSKICFVWQVGRNSSFKFRDCFLCFQTCMWSCTVLFKEDFTSTFVKLNSPETLLSGFKSLNLLTSKLMVWARDIMSIKITPYLLPPPPPRKAEAMTFHAEGVALNSFFLGDFGWYNFINCLLVCGSKWWIHVSSAVTFRNKNLSPSDS
jgi:hypothetical protein